MSRPHPKNPRTPPASLTLSAGDIVDWGGPLWRLHATGGTHPSRWDELRRTGPVPSCRWDPQPGPLGTPSSAGVSYAAPSPITSFAEVFQRDRTLSLTGDLTLSGWRPTRTLQLLDLLAGPDGSDWALRHGASASLPQAPRSTCRAWAVAIHDQLGDRIDGLLVPSTVLGDPMTVLFTRAGDAFPTAPAFSRGLDHPGVAVLAVTVRQRTGWPIR